MRHTTHIMLGADTAALLSGIKRFVVKYGNEAINPFFHAYHFPELDNGKNAFFFSADVVPVDDSLFVAGIDEMFNVQYGNPCVILADKRAEYIKGFFRTLYDRSVTINCPGDSSTMYLCVYVPLYDGSYWAATQEFLQAIETIPQNYHVDLFLLPYDTASVFEKKTENLTERIPEYASCSKIILKEILEAKRQFPSLGSLILLQNCNAEGLSLNLDADAFVRIAGEYALLSIEHYPEMFQPAAFDPERPLQALGLAVLSFDKYYFVQYLLHRAYAYILDREKISQAEVDVNKVSQIVQGILEKNVSFFTAFYEKEIAPRLNNGLDHTEIISQIGPTLHTEIQRLTEDFQSYLDRPDLSLPEKKATLAQLLGEDDDLLVGYMFNKKQLINDDCCREVLDLFVTAHNQICGMTPVLVVGDAAIAEAENNLRKAEVKRIKEYAVLNSKAEMIPTASELLDALKATKVAMRESTNYIRQKTIELEGIDIQRQDHRESFKRLTKEGFVFEGNLYKLQGDVEEIDLDEEYKPLTSVPSSVDLRSNFTPVRDQGELGACSAFALVGIMEYILKRNRQPDIDLSEQFVYYNARKDKDSAKLDAGSSLYDVIQTLKKDGVCLEHFFPYNPDNAALEPPVEAYNDAQSRKVVQAKYVKKDLHAIKSALSEGYPVAISLKIFDSFIPSKGFIQTPSDEEIQGELSGSHAMVICGYNDDVRFFVVRNSWGRKFGDKGYCYIPYGYIENVNLLNGACVITGISDTRLIIKDTDQHAVVSFDLTDSNIKAEILANLIREEKIKLDKLTNELIARSRVFNELFQQLGNNGVRESLSEGTIERLEWECCNMTRKSEELRNERTRELTAFDETSRKIRWWFWGSVTLFVLIYVLVCLIVKSLHPLFTTVSYIMYGVVALGSIGFWLVMRRRKRMRQDLDQDYKSQIDELAKKISVRQREKSITHLKTHLAGMIIDSLYKLGRNLHTKYNGMRSYLGNLKLWREQELESVKMSPLSRDPFLTLISNACLDTYFEANKEKITEGLSLSRMFKDKYNVREEEVVKFKNGLKQKLVDMLFAALHDFSIFKYVTGAAAYSYVSKDFMNIDALLRQMDYKSMPFVRLNPGIANSEGLNTHVKMMFLYTEYERDRIIWEEACNRNFNNAPVNHVSDNPFKITLLQLKGVSPKEVSILNGL